MTQLPAIRWRLLAIPTEHGGWVLLAAPLVLGLLLAPSWAGACLALAASFGFLARHPLRLALADLQRQKSYPRTRLALAFALAYSLASAAAFLGVIGMARGPFWIPLAGIAVLSVVQLASDLRGDGRRLVTEVVGAVALSLLAAAVCLAGGLDSYHSWIAFVVIGLHATTAVVYASTRLRLGRGQPGSALLVWVLQVVALCIVAPLGWPVAVAFGLLLGRSLWGLSRYRRDVRTATLGMQEATYTAMVVAATAWRG